MLAVVVVECVPGATALCSELPQLPTRRARHTSRKGITRRHTACTERLLRARRLMSSATDPSSSSAPEAMPPASGVRQPPTGTNTQCPRCRSKHRRNRASDGEACAPAHRRRPHALEDVRANGLRDDKLSGRYWARTSDLRLVEAEGISPRGRSLTTRNRPCGGRSRRPVCLPI